MRFEAIESNPKVDSISTQEHLIVNCRGVEQIQQYCKRAFHTSGLDLWSEELETYAHTSNPPQEYFKLVAITANGGSQYGFDFMNGQTFRHSHHGWKVPQFHPRHQLAMASYLGSINEQAYPIKEALCDEYEGQEDFEVGIWGINFPIRKGIVVFDSENSNIQASARRRYTYMQPIITYPHRELNQKLAGLEFSGDDADRMPNNEFTDDVLPRVVAALGEYLDPGLLSFHLRRNERSFRTF